MTSLWVTTMTDEHDPDLRRLFASTAEHPADEAFVAAVTARTAHARRFGPLARRLASGFGLAVAFSVAAATLGLSARVITPLLDATPMGLATALSLVVAGVVCLRLLASLASWRS